MVQENLKFCTSIDDVYGAISHYLSSQEEHAHELFQAFRYDYGDAAKYIQQFLEGQEVGQSVQQKKDTLVFLAFLDKSENKEVMNEFLQNFILRKNSGLSKSDIFAHIDEIGKSKKFHENFFEKTTRKSQENFSDENREVSFDSTNLINALRADITIMNPDIKLRKEIAKKNGYNHVGPWHPKHQVAICYEGKMRGVVDKQGKEILPMEDSYPHLSDDFIVKGFGRGKEFYDYTGKLIHDLTGYIRTLDASDGVIGMRDASNGEHGTHYIDQNTGEKLFELDNNFNHIGQFKDGLAKVRYGKRTEYGPKGQFGYINKKGEIVIPCEYDSGSQNENGYMIATKRIGHCHHLFILHFDGSTYTEREINAGLEAQAFARHFDDGSDRDRLGFVDGKFSMWDWDSHKWVTLDIEGEYTGFREKVIDLESGLKIVERYNRESERDQDHFFECDVFDKEGKEILSKKKFGGIDSANKLILLDDGIMTFEGEYIGPLKGHSLSGFVKRDEDS